MATYIIRAGSDGPVKIGRADDVAARLASLQTGNPAELVVVRIVDTPFDAEPLFHERFKERRLRGEWFEFDAEMLTFIPAAPVTAHRGDAIARMVSRFGLVNLAARIGVSRRTIENWTARNRNMPSWRHVRAMLHDRELAPTLLAAAGRADLANPRKTITDLRQQVIDRFGADHPAVAHADESLRRMDQRARDADGQ